MEKVESHWVSHNNPAIQTALALGSALIGMLLMHSVHPTAGSTANQLAGFLLGVMLFVLGGWAFFSSARQSITVDAPSRTITIEDQGWFGPKTRVIPFADIRHIGLGYLGKASNFVQFYYLVLTLRDGSHVTLFAPGRFYEGSSDRDTVEQWRQRLERFLVDVQYQNRGHDERSGI